MVELEIVFLELKWCIGEYYLTMYLKNKIRNTVENSLNKTYKALFIEVTLHMCLCLSSSHETKGHVRCYHYFIFVDVIVLTLQHFNFLL
jgi:hypothetical protein